MTIQDMWPQIATAVVVSTCSAIVTIIVQKTSKKLENVATKDFVTESLLKHGEQMERKIGDMFVKSSTQGIVNADIEQRLRRVEDAFGVRLRDFFKQVTETQ